MMFVSFNSNTMGGTSRAGTAYPSRAPALKTGVCRVRVAIQFYNTSKRTNND